MVIDDGGQFDVATVLCLLCKFPKLEQVIISGDSRQLDTYLKVFLAMPAKGLANPRILGHPGGAVEVRRSYGDGPHQEGLPNRREDDPELSLRAHFKVCLTFIRLAIGLATQAWQLTRLLSLKVLLCLPEMVFMACSRHPKIIKSIRVRRCPPPTPPIFGPVCPCW